MGECRPRMLLLCSLLLLAVGQQPTTAFPTLWEPFLGRWLSRSQSANSNLGLLTPHEAALESVTGRTLLQATTAGCASPQWLCPGCLTVSADLYQEITNGTCIPVPGVQLSMCSSSVVDSSVVTSVQSGQCSPACAGGASKMCSGAPAPGPAPLQGAALLLTPSSPEQQQQSGSPLVSAPAPSPAMTATRATAAPLQPQPTTAPATTAAATMPGTPATTPAQSASTTAVPATQSPPVGPGTPILVPVAQPPTAGAPAPATEPLQVEPTTPILVPVPGKPPYVPGPPEPTAAPAPEPAPEPTSQTDLVISPKTPILIPSQAQAPGPAGIPAPAVSAIPAAGSSPVQNMTPSTAGPSPASTVSPGAPSAQTTSPAPTVQQSVPGGPVQQLPTPTTAPGATTLAPGVPATTASPGSPATSAAPGSPATGSTAPGSTSAPAAAGSTPAPAGPGSTPAPAAITPSTRTAPGIPAGAPVPGVSTGAPAIATTPAGTTGAPISSAAPGTTATPTSEAGTPLAASGTTAAPAGSPPVADLPTSAGGTRTPTITTGAPVTTTGAPTTPQLAPGAIVPVSAPGTPSPASSSLPGSCSAGNISVTCTYNGCPQQIQPALYTYVTANQSSCVPIIGQMACGCYLLDTDTFDAITQGTCQLSCPPAQQTCSAAPAPAPGTGALLLPAGSTTAATALAPGSPSATTAAGFVAATPGTSPSPGSASTPTPSTAAPGSTLAAAAGTPGSSPSPGSSQSPAASGSLSPSGPSSVPATSSVPGGAPQPAPITATQPPSPTPSQATFAPGIPIPQTPSPPEVPPSFDIVATPEDLPPLSQYGPAQQFVPALAPGPAEGVPSSSGLVTTTTSAAGPEAMPPTLFGRVLTPAAAPDLCPTCANAQYLCNNSEGTFTASAAMYSAVLNATECVPDLNEDFCIVDEYIVELSVWDSIQANNCTLLCPEAGSLTCPAAPGPAPAAAFGALPPPTIAGAAAPAAAVAGASAVTTVPGTTSSPATTAEDNSDTALSIQSASLGPFSLNYGAWGECSEECGTGEAARPLTCVSKTYSLPVTLDNCNYNITDIQALEEPCNTAACGAFTWQLSPWSACSATCGDSGTTTRNATCLHNGQPVDSSSDTYFSSCLPLGQPTTVKPCLATPCNSYLWQLGPWSGCSNGQQTRPVTCQSIKGGIASNSVCGNQTGYTPPASRLCNTFVCKSNSDCSNAGTCNTAAGTCTCQAGFAGPSCSIATSGCNATNSAPNATFLAPANSANASNLAGTVLSASISAINRTSICCSTGIVDKQGSCCQSGVVNDAGTCCPAAQTPFAPTTLDRAGQCCAQALDACGVCGGSGLAIDFVGTCCTGALDASGLCCPLPNVVDDFGVCGGNSSTGTIVVDLDMVADAWPGLGTAGSAANANFTATAALLVGDALQVSPSQVQLQSLQLEPGSRRRLLTTPFSPRWVDGPARRLTAWDNSRAGLSSALGGIIGDVESYINSHAGAATFRPPFLPPRIPSGTAQGPSAGRNLLQSALTPASSPAASLLPTMDVTAAAVITPPYPALPFPTVLGALSDIFDGEPGPDGLAIRDVLGMTKEGVAGNGICEVGEMPTADGNNTGVPKDCPVTWHAVPSSGGKQCSGRGAPIAASGVCQCFTGYDGDACAQCADGYQLVNGICQRTLDSFMAQALAQSSQPSTAGKTAGASVGMIAAIVVGTVAALVVALGMYVAYRRRRSAAHRPRKGMAAARDAASSRASESGSSGRMAWAFSDPEHGSGSASSGGTTTLTTPDSGRAGDSKKGNFKIMLMDNKPLGGIAKLLSASNVKQDQVEVHSMERDTERGPASPAKPKKTGGLLGMFRRAAPLSPPAPTAVEPAAPEGHGRRVSAANSGFSGATIEEEDGEGEVDMAAYDKARRGSVAFSNSDAGSDTRSPVAAASRRGLFGFTMAPSGGDGAHRGARRGAPALSDASSDAFSDGRRRAGNGFGSMALSDADADSDQAAKTARGMRRGSLALSQGSSEGTSDSEQGRIMRSAGQFSFAEPDTGSVGKARVSRIGSLAFSQGSTDEERKGKRPNYAMSGKAGTAASDALARTNSIVSTGSRRNYAYTMDVAPGRNTQRKQNQNFSTVDASDHSSEGMGERHGGDQASTSSGSQASMLSLGSSGQEVATLLHPSQSSNTGRK